MPVYELNNELVFPKPEFAEPDGLLAVGGDLSVERLLFAFSMGIFPWFASDNPILWWAPDPRFVIFPSKAKISKSLKKTSKQYQVKINSDFLAVISNCAEIERYDQDGTWITKEMIEAYYKLHKLGYGYSFETYFEDKLVGGLYGVLCGKVFIGESMFHKRTDASKTAFKSLIEFCIENDIKVIDCQFHTDHLEKLGGEYITRQNYMEILEKHF